jgi:hypothetical protein
MSQHRDYLICEPWHRIEGILIHAFVDKNIIKGEYGKVIGALTFHRLMLLP